MIGVQLHGAAADVMRGLRAEGILTTRAGDDVLRLLPPLTVKRKEIGEFLAALDRVLATGAGVAPSSPSPSEGTVGGAVA